jgi:histidine triad (HIT) family protein
MKRIKGGKRKMNDTCVFCRIAGRKLPSNIVYEDDKVIAFEDIAPQAPVHIVVISKKHLPSQVEIKDFSLVGDIFAAINKIVVDKGISKSGFRVVANSGHDAGQAVLHLHFHVLGGRKLDWPPG